MHEQSSDTANCTVGPKYFLFWPASEQRQSGCNMITVFCSALARETAPYLAALHLPRTSRCSTGDLKPQQLKCPILYDLIKPEPNLFTSYLTPFIPPTSVTRPTDQKHANLANKVESSQASPAQQASDKVRLFRRTLCKAWFRVKSNLSDHAPDHRPRLGLDSPRRHRSSLRLLGLHLS